MSHRVIAGSAKGRRLSPVPGDSTRPIMDRAKEALFNIIGRDIYGAVCLDLFAGTGAVGIEALSRGADHATFIDKSPAAVRTIKQNLAATHLAERANVRRADAFTVLARRPTQPYSLIYIAPPQYHGLWARALTALEANPGWIPGGTSVIVQIDPKEREQDPLPTLSLLETQDSRQYGKTLLWFLTSTRNHD